MKRMQVLENCVPPPRDGHDGMAETGRAVPEWTRV